MEPTSIPTKTASSRILALDYLRGFFILIIIADHLWRWPNAFEFISGRGELWSSAAEGFVIISGLLVGYIRGYKNRHQPLRQVSKKLVSRGVMLYIWMIITTFILVCASWLQSFRGNMAYVPIETFNWSQLALSVLRLDYVHTLTHFLYLYAIFLVLSPLVVWALRIGYAWLVALVSIGLWFAGFYGEIEWLQWQVLFFLPAIGGLYLEPLLNRYYNLPLSTRRMIRFGSIGAMLLSVAVALAAVLPHPPGSYQNSLFGRDPITIGTIVISFVWFVGLLSLFQLLLPYLQKFGAILLTLGEKSLTAYILHTIPLVLCALLFPVSNNIIVNSLLTIGAILFTWGLLKIPGINKVIPR